MARVTFSQDDINRSKILPPGWYTVRVTKFEATKANTDGSELYIYELKVLEGPFKDVPIRYQISEKAMGMGIEFLESGGVEVKAGVPVELEKMLGKTMDCFNQRGEYNGRPQNNVVTFRKSKGGQFVNESGKGIAADTPRGPQ